MAEKLTLKALSDELKLVLQRVGTLEQQVESSMEAALEKARKTLDCIRHQDSASDCDEEQRRRMVAEAAYYKALHRGFQGGDPEQDWREAEREIEQHRH